MFSRHPLSVAPFIKQLRPSLPYFFPFFRSFHQRYSVTLVFFFSWFHSLELSFLSAAATWYIFLGWFRLTGRTRQRRKRWRRHRCLFRLCSGRRRDPQIYADDCFREDADERRRFFHFFGRRQGRRYFPLSRYRPSFSFPGSSVIVHSRRIKNHVHSLLGRGVGVGGGFCGSDGDQSVDAAESDDADCRSVFRGFNQQVGFDGESASVT